MKRLPAILFILFASYLRAQVNLVPNSSFEVINAAYDSVTSGCGLVTGGFISFYNQVPPWDSPSDGSPDPLNICANSSNAGIPFNSWGYQLPHNGNGFGGLAFYLPVGYSYREYIQVRLDSTLVINRKYCINFYVNLSDSSRYAVNNIGLYLSNSHIYQPMDSVLNFTPQINDTNIISDTANWTLISGQYTAFGGEQYILIGNFFSDAFTNKLNKNGNLNAAYYYIDDVSVIYCDPSEVDEVANSNEEVLISPNPATNEIMLTSNQKLKTIHIYNVLGEEVLKLERIANKEKAIDISTWNAGVYFVEVETEKGIVRKKLVKE